MWVFGRGLGTSREMMLRGGRVVVGRGVMSWIGSRFMSFGPSEEGKEKEGGGETFGNPKRLFSFAF